MSGFVAWLQSTALALGALGLLIVGFLDSSFLSLPEITDILVVYMVTRHPARLLVYVIAATLGSLIWPWVVVLTVNSSPSGVPMLSMTRPWIESAAPEFGSVHATKVRPWSRQW